MVLIRLKRVIRLKREVEWPNPISWRDAPPDAPDQIGGSRAALGTTTTARSRAHRTSCIGACQLFVKRQAHVDCVSVSTPIASSGAVT